MLKSWSDFFESGDENMIVGFHPCAITNRDRILKLCVVALLKEGE